MLKCFEQEKHLQYQTDQLMQLQYSTDADNHSQFLYPGLTLSLFMEETVFYIEKNP